MSPVTHPLDHFLGLHKWSRATLDDLGSKSEKTALSLICRAANFSATSKVRIIARIDVNAWRSSDKVYFEIVSAGDDPLELLSQLTDVGPRGVSPLAIGLVPCRHSKGHWNPMCMPLVWQQSMNNLDKFDVLMRRYVKALDQPGWQCPDTVKFMG